MNLGLLPKFGGELHEPWDLHQVRLLSWFRIHQIPDNDDKVRVDYLILSLKPNSSPLNWFINQPTDQRATFNQSLNLLQNKYGSDLRKEMHRISAMNCLEVRSFRDNEHKTEMVFELINELEQLLTCAAVNQDVQRREFLLRCFRGFSGALKMMNRTTTYDSAVLAALNWEASVISKAEEAMIRAVLKRQVAQKSQNTHPRDRPKRNSNPADPSLTHPPLDRPDDFITQDFQPNTDAVRLHPEAYYRTHLPPSQLRHQKSSNENHSNSKAQQTSATSAAAYVNAGMKDESDPSQMMESLVDPHLIARQSPRRLHEFYQLGNHPNLAEANPDSQEVVDNPGLPTAQNQKFKIKPLVYDAQKNPYPPPEQLAENQMQKNRNDRLNPSPSYPIPQHPFEKYTPGFPTPNPQDLEPSKHFASTSSDHGAINSSVTTRIPFPSPQASSQPLPGPSSARKSPVPPMTGGTQQPAFMPARTSSSSQRGTFLDSTLNLHSNTGSILMPPAQLENEEIQGSRSLKKRPSKLVKLRRKGSGSTNNSNSSSTGSFQQVRSFIGNLNKRAGRSSQSGDESDSTQDHGPNTPSSLEPGGGGSASGFDSEGNERLRPMQAQFYRLFRKHNHPEHLRRQNRATFLGKPSPPTSNAIKGKGRAVDIHLMPVGSNGAANSTTQRNQPVSKTGILRNRA